VEEYISVLYCHQAYSTVIYYCRCYKRSRYEVYVLCVRSVCFIEHIGAIYVVYTLYIFSVYFIQHSRTIMNVVYD